MNESNGLAGAIAPLAKYLENCWLDSGALLGLVREGNLIAWDSDIDLGVWESDAAPITAALPHIRAEGYRVSSRSYKGRVYGYTMEEPGRRHAPVHVHVYSRKGDTAWSPQTVAYAPHQRAAVYDGFRGSVAMRDGAKLADRCSAAFVRRETPSRSRGRCRRRRYGRRT